MHRATTLQYQAGSNRATVRLVQHLLQRLAHLRMDFIDGSDVRDIDVTPRPAQDIQITVFDGFDVTIVYSNQRAALGAGLAGMAPLDIARKDNPGILADNLSIMDMSQCPVLVTPGTQAIDSARRIGLMARLAVQAGVQETNIEKVRIGWRISPG